MPVVTIRGSLGTGAPEIGRLVARKLRFAYIDREIIREVSARLNLPEEDILAKETLPSSLRGRIADFIAQGYSEGDSFEAAYLPFWQMPLDDASYLETLKSFINEVSHEHSVVIHGRGGQFILKNHPGALHALIVSPFEFRLKRVMETLGLSEIKAKQEIIRFDNSTREVMKRFFGAEVEDPNNYDVVVNAAHFGFENAATMITQALPLKQFHNAAADPGKEA
jgi:cytidylate kinase